MEHATIITSRQLLEAGVHFGHQTKKWNPKMKKYILQERKGLYIINLSKTLSALKEAYQFIVDEIKNKNKVLLFLGTKKQAKNIIEEEAKKCNMPYVNQRWLGGTLTNFATIRRRIEYLEDLEKKKEEGYFENFSKKERAAIDREIEKLQKSLGGIRQLNTVVKEYISEHRFDENRDTNTTNLIYDCLRNRLIIFIIDPKKEYIALQEAMKLNIPIVALVDTNCDPDGIDYPIPANDDSIKSIKLLTSIIAKAVLEASNIVDKEDKLTKDQENVQKEELVNI